MIQGAWDWHSAEQPEAWAKMTRAYALRLALLGIHGREVAFHTSVVRCNTLKVLNDVAKHHGLAAIHVNLAKRIGLGGLRLGVALHVQLPLCCVRVDIRGA